MAHAPLVEDDTLIEHELDLGGREVQRVKPDKNSGRVRRSKASRPREHSRYDQALFAAKNNGQVVRFTLAQEASFADEDCEVDATVLQVDKFDIEIQPTNEGWGSRDSIWLKKSSIMATRIFP